MRFSENWLNEFVRPVGDPAILSEQLTMAGLEVESIDTADVGFRDIIIARVISTSRDPKFETLTLCKLDTGSGETREVLCGAPNVVSDGLFAYAGPGACLPGGVRIEKRTIKDTVSEGMLCSERELGLSENADRLLQLGEEAQPGQSLSDYLELDDRVIELSLTPNRGDCLSLVGIAREVSVANRSQLILPESETVIIDSKASRDIILESPGACPRYSGRIIENINASAPTPGWVLERLRRSGIRGINVLVDLTNYVMLELGQPMHAFDNDRLQGDIRVRMARKDESLVLLDGDDYSLRDDTLVIADDSGAIAMAGIMGGEATAVSEGTRSVFLESAFFSPRAIMGRARHYGLHTDASHRFERGVDPELPVRALDRLSGLIRSICGGQAGPIVDVTDKDNLEIRETVHLRSSRLDKVLGEAIPAAEVTDILQRLGFSVQPVEDGWQVTPPGYRFDISIEADLIEEIARIQGYDRFTDSLPRISLKLRRKAGHQAMTEDMGTRFSALGYREIISYSFVDSGLQSMLFPEIPAVSLLNPISEDMGVMRVSLWPGLIRTLQHNCKRQQSRLRLFETGHVFKQAGAGIEERPEFAGLVYGKMYPEQWNITNRSSDFYDLKSDIQALLHPYLPVTALRYRPLSHCALHDTQAAEITYENRVIGLMGAVHPGIMRKLELPGPIYLFSLDLTAVPREKAIKYQKLSKFPWIRRDISIIIDDKIPVFQVIEHINSMQNEALHNLELFDVYRGEGIDLGKKSLALGLTFQGTSSTLTDEEADIVVDNILHSLNEVFGAILREA